MAERREEEEGEEGARRWSSGSSYRPRGSWARDVATGGGRFGSGRTTASERSCSGAAQGQVALGDFLGPFGRGRAVDEVHRRRTAGGGRNRASQEREMEMGALLRFLKIPGTSR